MTSTRRPKVDEAPRRANRNVADHGVALAAGKHAANRAMHEEGRTGWNAEDWELARATYNRVMGL